MTFNSKIILSAIHLLLSNSGWAEYKKTASPVAFIKNNGQWQKEILYKGTSTSPVSFLKDGISFAQSGKDKENPDGSISHPFVVWNMKFLNGNKSININGINRKKSVYSYLSGNEPDKWIIHPEECSVLEYQSVYKNIDLLFYGTGNSLKYDFIVRKGGNIHSIQSYYEGIEKLALNKSGELEVTTLYNIQIQRKPVAWQNINGIKKYIVVNYILINDSTFGFEAPHGFNSNYSLTIDPLFQMVWSSYTMITGGSNNINYCFSNAMDLDGNVYLTGMVDDSFPITPGAYSGPGNVQPEIFVAKFSGDGTTLLYWTYLPGSSSEFGVSIATDSLGRAYVTGVVDLNITGLTTFPSTPNAFQPLHNAGSDAFLTVLNPTGTGLDYSSFLGGTGSETGYDVAIGANGIAFIAGHTSIGNFPVKATTSFPTGDNDLFVAKFDINQSGANSLIYSTRIGGGSFSYVHGRSISVNNTGNVFVTGTIHNSSGTTNYPTTPGAYNTVYNTGLDGVMFFVTKLSANTPVTLSYSTFIAPGTGNGIAVNKTTDEVVIVGNTNTFSFPVTTGALQTIHAGTNGSDAFAVKLNAAGTNLVYATFIGGPNWDNGTSVVVNSLGEAYVAGMAEVNFPTSFGCIQPNFAGGWKDFFVVHLNASGTGYGCGGSTYVGGSDADYSGSFYDFPAPQISIRDHAGFNDSISISATTHSQDFPTTPGAYGPVKVNGIADQPVFFKLTCVPAGGVPSINLNSSDTSWCDKKAIDFFDLSTNNPTSWQWYFQGATPDTSTLQNPTGIYYPAYGTFDVKLVACNTNGCDSLYLPAFITEYQLPPSPVITQSGDTLLCTPAYSYQWHNLNGPIPGATDYKFIAVDPGTYFIVITDSLGCSSSSNYLVVTGLNDPFLNRGISVFPNPASDDILISFIQLKQGDITFQLHDLSGRSLIQKTFHNLDAGTNTILISLSVLHSGLYFCQISQNNDSKAFKLVKK